MGFDPGIDVTNCAAIAYGTNYVDGSEGVVYTLGTEVSNVPNEYGTNYVSTDGSGSIFTTGKHVDNVGNDYGLPYVSMPEAPAVFSPGVKVADYYSRLLRPGDTGIDISMVNQKRQSAGRIISIY